jgi:acetyltransferase-like isoleucine patch superfamily enzyme
MVMSIKEAIKIPIFIHWRTKVRIRRGSRIYITNPRIKGIEIGFKKVALYDSKRSISIIDLQGGAVSFLGTASFGQGTRLSIGAGACLSIGDQFCSTAELKTICYNKIDIAESVLIGWEVLITDNNFHCIKNIETGIVSERSKPIFIGSNVWLGAKSIILPGAKIMNNCVVAAGSVCNKDYKESNLLIAGSPAVVRKVNIERVL